MYKLWSSYFNSLSKINVTSKFSIKTLPVVFIFVVILFLFFYKVNCLLIRENTGDVIFIKKILENDEIVLSHINSIYDAKVEEVFNIEGDMLVLKEIRTSSYGVKEYYGITDGMIKRQFSTITFRNTKDREFSLRINKEKIKNIDVFVDTPVTIELKKIPTIRYLIIKGTLLKKN